MFSVHLFFVFLDRIIFFNYVFRLYIALYWCYCDRRQGSTYYSTCNYPETMYAYPTTKVLSTITGAITVVFYPIMISLINPKPI